jgi:hypothetical protein
VVEWGWSQADNEFPGHDLGELVRERVSEGLTQRSPVSFQVSGGRSTLIVVRLRLT